MRGWLAAWLLGLTAFTSPAIVAAAQPALEVRVLDPTVSDATLDAVTSGSLDSRFGPLTNSAPKHAPDPLWLRVRSDGPFNPAGIPVLIARMGWFARVKVFTGDPASGANAGGHADPGGAGEAPTTAAAQPLPHATDLREFGGAHDGVFILPGPLEPGQYLYVRATAVGDGIRSLRFQVSTLDATLARAAEHARMIAIAFGALMAMSLGALLIWFILKDKLFILYPALFFLEALYLVFFSGEGFDWPLFSYARAISAYTWNVPVALAGAVACLFIREIADLSHTSPRVYKAFGWLAWTFVALAFSNIATLIGWGGLVAAIGNLVFAGAAIFTLVAAFLAWRRGNRAAGWFLIAWTMLETVAFATAIRLLFNRAEDAEGLLYYGLPLSVVAAAILVALGIADRLREQRLALSDAERRAQTDPLTGVLNRRSLIERLDAACLRARARGLPIALLFIDLDHFKEINDTFGHAAGDACLHAVIGPIQAELRQSDVIGRYGGEEFVVILSSADIAAAHPIAERIRNRVADVRIEGYGAPIQMTCSIGVATSDTLGVWGEHLIAQADARRVRGETIGAESGASGYAAGGIATHRAVHSPRRNPYFCARHCPAIAKHYPQQPQQHDPRVLTCTNGSDAMHAAPSRIYSAFACAALLGVSALASTHSRAADIYDDAVQHVGRSDADLKRDPLDHPADVLRLAKIKPGMRVADVLAGDGYYSELLSYIVGPKGHVLLINNEAFDDYTEGAYDKRLAGNRLPNVEHHTVDLEHIDLPDASLDALVLIKIYHDIYWIDTDPKTTWPKMDANVVLNQLTRVLKPGGTLLIVDHSAKAGTGSADASTLHRIDEAYTVKDFEKRGFKLVGKSDVLRIPADPRDQISYKKPALGKTDRFVLVFKKTA